jgi:O-antigen/teichoic acid export membrane protein
LIERVFPRLASAILMVLLAHFVTPVVVGLYVWPTIIITFYYAALDGAVRQVVVPSFENSSAYGFLLRYRFWASICGASILLVTLALMWVVFPPALHSQIAAMTPLVLVPVANSFAVIPIGFLQRSESWSRLASAQVVVALASLAVSLPLLFLTRSLLGASVQVFLGELFFALFVQRAALKAGLRSHLDSLAPGHTPSEEFRHSAWFFILGWAQGQADRILLGTIAGTAALGSYNLAMAVARNPGDAVSSSTANVVRVRVAGAKGRDLVRKIADHVLLRAVLLSASLVIVLNVVTAIVLRPLLGAAWVGPLEAVYPASLSIIITTVSWSLTPVLLVGNRMRFAVPIKAIGIVLAAPIAVAALHTVEAAAWAVFGRELVLLALLSIACGRAVPYRAICASLLVTLLLGAVLLVTVA